RSIWINQLRAQKIRAGHGLIDAEEALVIEGAEQIETNIFAAQVFRQVQLLPEAQRETVFLVYVEGLTYQEAASVLNVPPGTIMSRLAAARLKLRNLQEQAGEGIQEKYTMCARSEDIDMDALLVAYLDGELEPEAHEELERRLHNEAALRARLTELAEGVRPIRASFDALLEGAPRPRLEMAFASAVAKA